MPSILGILNGFMYSVMNLFNAQLSQLYGNAAATAMIHLVGLAALLPFAFHWGRPAGKAPWYLYIGGPTGILMVLCANAGISGVGITMNLSLALLGQMTLSAVIDQKGWFGISPSPMNGKKAASMGVILLGICVMLFWPGENGLPAGNDAPVLAVAAGLSFLSGFAIVAARISNAKLAAKAGLGFSTVMNYVTGLLGSLIVLAVSGFPMAQPFPAQGVSFTVYLGGLMGVASIIICNLITLRLTNVRMTLLIFVGQIFSGVLLDAFLLHIFSPGQLAGGLLVAAGLTLNVLSDRGRAELKR